VRLTPGRLRWLMGLNGVLGIALLSLVLVAYRRVDPPPTVDFNAPDRELRIVPNPAHPYNNSLGFRGEEFGLEKSAGTTRIVFLGDSATYSILSVSYVGVLNQRYRESRCEFINAAVTTYDAVDMSIRYERDVVPLNPDIVIGVLPTAHFIRHRPSVGLGLLEVGLRHMDEIAKQEGDDLWLIMMPILIGSNLDYISPYWGDAANAALEVEMGYADSIKQIMTEHSERLLDVSAADWSTALFYDRYHFNEAGHQAFAAWLGEQVFREMCGV
jgi:lysophospholipase L1-like esterase